MKRMPNHGSQLHMGSSSMLADPNYQGGSRNFFFNYKKNGSASIHLLFPQAEKGGILKKPGPPYGPLDVSSIEKEKWLEENAERLSRLDRMDRISTSSQNQLVGLGGGEGEGREMQLPQHHNTHGCCCFFPRWRGAVQHPP